MTIITGRQFRANIAETDKEVEDYKQAASLTALAAKAEQDHKNGNTIKCNTIEELHSFLDSL